MITTERLKEMRQAELSMVQRPFAHPAVKKIAEDYAEAIGELIELRHAGVPVATEQELRGYR